MLKEANLIEEWMEESAARARAAEARELLLELLRARFGELPPSVIAQVENAEPEWCREMAVRLLKANSLDELGLNGQ